jgi:hypothetical protein
MNSLLGIDTAVSEIVGALTLITIFVAAAAIIIATGVSGPSVQTIPALNINISVTGNLIRVFHAGGDTIPVGEITILANGAPVAFSGAGSDQLWQIGETLVATAPGAIQSVQVEAQSGSGQYLLASYG